MAFGEVMLRLAPPPGERLVGADRWSVHVAGAEANVAVDLAMLGVPVAWVGALPENPLGARAAAALRAAGVDLHHVDWVPGARMGLFLVDHGVGPRPTSVVYDRAGSAFATAARWPAGALADAAFAVVSGVTAAVSAKARSAALAMAAEAAATGTRLCVDVNYRARLWSAGEARAALAPLLRGADIVICSERDAAVLFDLDGDPAALRDRIATDASICVITRSDRGAVALCDGEYHEAPAVETEIRDRLGMGDAFVAGLLHGLLDGCDAADALRRATALAAMKATIAGDHALVDAGELRAAASGDRPRVLR